MNYLNLFRPIYFNQSKDPIKVSKYLDYYSSMKKKRFHMGNKKCILFNLYHIQLFNSLKKYQLKCPALPRFSSQLFSWSAQRNLKTKCIAFITSQIQPIWCKHLARGEGVVQPFRTQPRIYSILIRGSNFLNSDYLILK